MRGEIYMHVYIIISCYASIRTRLQLALEALSYALALDALDAESHYLMAYTLLFLYGNRNKELHMILQRLNRCIELENTHIAAHFLKGFVLQVTVE